MKLRSMAAQPPVLVATEADAARTSMVERQKHIEVDNAIVGATVVQWMFLVVDTKSRQGTTDCSRLQVHQG